jgi:hypothetical protein
MATIGTNALTLADLAKRMDSNDKIARIIELLAQKNQILDDMRWVEGNLPTGHRSTVRAGLPQATWRKLNYGVQPSKSTPAQITDTCGMLETYAEIDKALADLNGNAAEFRLSEDQAFLESMNQEMARTLFYGNTEVTPERFMGLSHRYNTRNAGTPSAMNVIHGGGTGSDNTSIWLVVWGELTVHGIVPKGSKAGLQHRDLGEQTLLDADSGKYQGYRTHYKWDAGLTVRDWRHAVRIANINVPGLDGETPADIIKLMIKATHRVPSLTAGMPVFYCNRDIRQWLDIQALNKSNVQLKLEMVEGKPKTDFLGIPIKTCDQIVSTEEMVPS